MDTAKIVSMKLISGEEIICRALSINEDPEDGTFTFTIQDPYVAEYNSRKRKSKCSLIPWMLMSDQEEFHIDATTVMVVSEVNNQRILEEYEKLVPMSKLLDPPQRFLPGLETSVDTKENTSGYVGNTLPARDILEKIYKADPADRT